MGQTISSNDISQIEKNVVTNPQMIVAVKQSLLIDPAFKAYVNDYLKANPTLFRGEKGEVDFKLLSVDDQAELVAQLVSNYSEILANKLSSNVTFQGALVNTMKTIAEFRGPAGIIDTLENRDFLKKSTLWCDEGSDVCKLPTNKKGISFGLGNLTTSTDGATLLMNNNGVPKVQIGNDITLPKRNNKFTVFDNKDDGFNYISGQTFMDEKLNLKGGIGLNGATELNVYSPNMVLGAGQTKSNWILSAPDNDQKSLYFAPSNGASWDYTKGLTVNSDGIQTNKITVGTWTIQDEGGSLVFKQNGSAKTKFASDGNAWFGYGGTWINNMLNSINNKINNDETLNMTHNFQNNTGCHNWANGVGNDGDCNASTQKFKLKRPT